MNRPTLVVANDLAELRPQQTTSMLCHGFAERGATWATDVMGLDVLPDGGLLARAKAVRALATPDETLAALAGAETRTLLLDRLRVIVRTNPARDRRRWAHEHLLGLLRFAERRGVPVHNRADGLTLAHDKTYLSRLPAHLRPETLISADRNVLRDFVRGRTGSTVLKPVEGTRGQDVFRVDPQDDNLNQILDVLCRQGVAMAQGYMPEAPEGDVRVLVLDGQPVCVDGEIAAVRRRPRSGDFRSNIAIGGRAEYAAVSPALQAACRDAGAQLVADGLRFVGLDFVGNRIVEANVFSPGGLFDAGRFAHRDFLTPVVEALMND